MHQISLKLVHKNIVSVRLLFGEEGENYEENPTSFRDSYLRNCWGYIFLSNLVCEVLYMKTLKHVELDLVEIGTIVFEL